MKHAHYVNIKYIGVKDSHGIPRQSSPAPLVVLILHILIFHVRIKPLKLYSQNIWKIPDWRNHHSLINQRRVLFFFWRNELHLPALEYDLIRKYFIWVVFTSFFISFHFNYIFFYIKYNLLAEYSKDKLWVVVTTLTLLLWLGHHQRAIWAIMMQVETSISRLTTYLLD